MKEQVVLVDFENVQKLDPAHLRAHALTKIVAAQQAKVPTALVPQTQAVGLAIEWIRIERNGPNVLDFDIACHLRECLAGTPPGEAPSATKAVPKQVLDANA